MSFGLFRFAVAGIIAVGGATSSYSAFAQENPVTPPAAQAPAAPAPAPAPPAANPAQPPALTTPAPAPAAPEAAKPGESTPPAGEASTGETVDLPARPFAYIEGKADRDEIYTAILGSLGIVKRDMEKANLVPAGRPLA